MFFSLKYYLFLCCLNIIYDTRQNNIAFVVFFSKFLLFLVGFIFNDASKSESLNVFVIMALKKILIQKDWLSWPLLPYCCTWTQCVQSVGSCSTLAPHGPVGDFHRLPGHSFSKDDLACYICSIGQIFHG